MKKNNLFSLCFLSSSLLLTPQFSFSENQTSLSCLSPKSIVSDKASNENDAADKENGNDPQQNRFKKEISLILNHKINPTREFVKALSDYVFSLNPSSIIKDSSPKCEEVIPYIPSRRDWKEVVFFFKPECFMTSDFLPGKDFKNFFEEALTKLTSLGLVPGGVRIINGAYLRQNHMVTDHYMAANRVARGDSPLSETARQKAREKSSETGWPEVQGFFPYFQAREGINQFFAEEVISENLNEVELEKILWDDADPNRPKGKGDASQYFRLLKAEHKGKTGVFAIYNGYVVNQALHFYRQGVIALNMRIPEKGPEIKELRDIVGATDPMKAAEGTLRFLFRDYFSKAGMAYNGTHFSAGWLEGACEGRNWFGNPGSVISALIEKGLSAKEIQTIFGKLRLNPVMEFKGKMLPVFDHLEVQDFETNLELILSFASFTGRSSETSA